MRLFQHPQYMFQSILGAELTRTERRLLFQLLILNLKRNVIKIRQLLKHLRQRFIKIKYAFTPQV